MRTKTIEAQRLARDPMITRRARPEGPTPKGEV